MADQFDSKSTLRVGSRDYEIHRLDAVEKRGLSIGRLPFSLRILMENLLRHQDAADTAADVEALAKWDPSAEPDQEIAFTPARVLLQDFTGVPAVVDLAAMRDAMARMGGDPTRINPLQPAELVIDHSVQVDEFGTRYAFDTNSEMEYRRNQERYAFLRWGQKAFDNFRVVPPETGIVHQVNLEYLARVVFGDGGKAYPDTLVGTDSHTTMVNGLGVLGWGVGGIEAEAAMLGQAVSMLIPQVVGFRLEGELPEGSTATDLVLRVTEMLRKRGVVGRFVEFYGPGLERLPLADRATIGNMAPEYGATCGIFPVDEETLRYLRFTGRDEDHVKLVEAYMKEQGLFHTKDTPTSDYTDTLQLDLSTVEPSLAGPKRPQDRIRLSDSKRAYREALPTLAPGALRGVTEGGTGASTTAENAGSGAAAGAALAQRTGGVRVRYGGAEFELSHGDVVIAAITSCTNTSNPSVMVAAGLLAKKAAERGLRRKPWVKTSLAPGSKVVMDYLTEAGLMPALEELGFHLVGYGCTTCIGNSGPLPEEVSAAIKEGDLVACSVLSGNRNFEGRINPDVRANYLASPPLVVAYALAGTMDIDLYNEPLGEGSDGRSVFLKDVWPTQMEVQKTMAESVLSEQFTRQYASVFEGDARWKDLPVPEGERFAWNEKSTYVKEPPYFADMGAAPAPVHDIVGARVLALMGDSITTDHISPAGSISRSSPAAKYLMSHGVEPKDFNSYGSRRGNHEVMMRGTFANVRFRNRLTPEKEGGWSRHLPDGKEASIFDVAMKYRDEGTPLIVIAGKEYGTGSSRDWAAKGPALLGVRAAIAETYERIHRSNLVGMGVLPLQFEAGETAGSLGLTGEEVYAITGLPAAIAERAERRVMVVAGKDGKRKEFTARVRLDTPQEVEYYRHGGILQYVLRQLLKA
ncbi:MAG TPA: aconitate hydratase AcnA [Longimicrobiales bacterium]|nr:aconitate hydratase AcnA [Longimicrobiales bacterium]